MESTVIRTVFIRSIIVYKEIAINHKPIPILIINANNVVKSNGLCGLITQ